MRTLDPSPVERASAGVDRFVKTLDAASRVEESAFSCPPYNIEKVSDDAYRIVMAVAGFAEDELNVTAKENSLVISGKKEKPEDDKASVIHQRPRLLAAPWPRRPASHPDRKRAVTGKSVSGRVELG